MEFTSQISLEQTFSKYQLHACIRNEFVEAGFAQALYEKDIPTDFGLDMLIQLVLHKRCNIPILVGLLRKHFTAEERPGQAAAGMILKMCEEDFADWEDVSQTVVMKYNISADVQEKLDVFQYPLPMIEEPSHVRHNRQTGYRTIKGSLLLRDNHHEEDICLDHINRCNRIPLALNADVVAFIQNRWKNLDKPKDGEDYAEYRKRVKAFEKYDSTSRDVLAALMSQGDRFWLTHRYDKRGRTYCQGYHVNPQGNDWNKACIQFADPEPLNEE